MLTNGIVEAKQNGKMTIRIEEDAGVCETCAIRAFCKKRDCDGNQIVLNDRDGIGVGDPVNVEENRGILMKTSTAGLRNTPAFLHCRHSARHIDHSGSRSRGTDPVCLRDRRPAGRRAVGKIPGKTPLAQDRQVLYGQVE
ncbi:MAG: hypothetical protein U5N26_02885 [Candidatus Marinimicrobia bacterium]|nr:hypothetical protein [Candidatus Neomarinimicrobiota bacterium]